MRKDTGENTGKKAVVLLLLAAVMLLACTGCSVLGKKLTFFPGLEVDHGKEQAEDMAERFFSFVEETDFSAWDYGVTYEIYDETSYARSGGETFDVPEEWLSFGAASESTGTVQAYRNLKRTVFQAEMSDGTYYYNQQEGMLHCDQGNGTKEPEGKEVSWEELPFDEISAKANAMLHYLADSGDYLDVVYEYVSKADYEYKNMLRIYYWDHQKEGLPQWSDQGGQWADRFGQGEPWEIFVACSEDGSAYQAVVMRWDEPFGRCEVVWNSYDALLQSERCVIRYEYAHGLRPEGNQDLSRQREALLREMGEEPYYR